MNEIEIVDGIECYEKDDVAYLKLEAVARGLGFTQEKNGAEYIRWERVRKCLGLSENIEFITQMQLEKLIQSTNKIIDKEMYKLCGLEEKNVILSKEQETIGFIKNCFKNITEVVSQYQIGKYKIDLYFPKYKVAVECDEFNHSDRNREYEEKREQYIKEQLGCKFIRYNPDSKSFSIDIVISNINEIIFNKQGGK